MGGTPAAAHGIAVKVERVGTAAVVCAVAGRGQSHLVRDERAKALRHGRRGGGGSQRLDLGPCGAEGRLGFWRSPRWSRQVRIRESPLRRNVHNSSRFEQWAARALLRKRAARLSFESPRCVSVYTLSTYLPLPASRAAHAPREASQANASVSGSTPSQSLPS